MTGGPYRLQRKYQAEKGKDDFGKTPEEQEDLVEKLREALEQRGAWSPKDHDFYMLLRFLRAREYDVDRATTMFLDMLQWRQENRVDFILQEFRFDEREEFLGVYPQGYHKTDKTGHPVYIQHLGRINLAKIYEVSTEERMLKYHIQEYERCLKYIFPICSKLQGRQIDKTFAIIDVKGVGFYHLTKEVRKMMATVTKLDSDNYPETLYHTCIINAPGAFRAMWAMVKPLLNKRTQDKIEICPKDYYPVLTKWIEEENIPEYLGGKSKGTLVDDAGPWHNSELIKQVEAEMGGLPEPLQSPTVTSRISPRPEDWLANRQPSAVSIASVYEDALPSPTWGDVRLNDYGDGDSLYTGGLDPPGNSDITSGSDDHGKSRSLSTRIHDLEQKLPRQESRLKPYLDREYKKRVKDQSTGATRYSLMGRVEVLEEGMELLLAAQERSWEDPTGGQGPGCIRCARCCSIM